MIFYLIHYFFATIIVIYKKRSTIISCWLISVLSIIAIIGLRNEQVGTDTTAYYRIFRTVSRNPEAWNGELLFIYFNRMISYFGGGPEAVIFFSALITVGIITYTIYRYSPSLLLSLSLFFAFGFFAQFFNGMRQAIAIALILYSIKYIINNNFIKFLIIIIFAMGFHATSIIFFPVYFLAKAKLNWVHCLIIWMLSFVFIIKHDLMFLIINRMVFFIPERQMLHIFNSFGRDALGIRLFFMQFIMLLLLFAYKKIRNKENKIILLLSIFGIIADNICFNAGVLKRLTHFFSIFLLIGIPVAIDFTFKKYAAIVVKYFLYICCIVLFVNALLSGTNGIVPYFSIFR